ncbi:glucose-6-phosphate isomerase [Marinobacterium sp. AK62]|uniref:Glucose-6-phosphate isomerase n=1 Tax=Marinobacterium alkalitolerans TaxID=1542925 RepID=A0ABS3ZBC8_9GAMM|nr:glucose-6-phosphate isomerase [Marinobacterium alkalitolerans]MBP0049001.1 glucose-6-phosphate isomerase [Marinobacterium alkalitolerans]
MDKQKAWRRLEDTAQKDANLHLKGLLMQPGRFEQFSFRHDEILLDLSRQRLTSEVLDQLLSLAGSCHLDRWIDDLFSGAPVNQTERRPALHTALRYPPQHAFNLDGRDINSDVQSALSAMEVLVNQLHKQQWRGFSGEPIDTLVNIGVGGSDLGPMMVCHALEEFQPPRARAIQTHFISSMDGSQLSSLLQHLDPERTLFIVSSKSFTTADTLANAATARDWLKQASHMPEDLLLKRHFVGITACPDKAFEWGLAKENLLHFWDWVGGRYSLWSTIGFSIAVRIGMKGFRALLDGAWRMDEHFRHADWSQNLPVLLALTEIWNINFQHIHAHAILPYDGRLAHLPAYLEQLEMESNGKSVDRCGQPVSHRTCPVLWGEIGPNAQHAFYQLLHQGSEPVMCDFIVAASRYGKSSESLQSQHRLTLANCLAQARVLALGDDAIDQSSASPWQHYAGNQPSTLLLLDQLSPATLGALIALYEHKVFVQSVIWDINPFDQWGVELGKQMANTLLPHIGQAPSPGAFDKATDGLLAELYRVNQEETTP